MEDKIRVEFFYVSGESTELIIPLNKWADFQKQFSMNKNNGTNPWFFDLTDFVVNGDESNTIFVNIAMVETIVIGKPFCSTRKVLCE